MSGPLSEAELRGELVCYGRWLYDLGFVPGTSGNLSVRLDRERVLATPTGCSKYLLQPCDMVVVDFSGRHISGQRNVTSEIGMHLAVYRARPDIGAVVHAHPAIATGFASSGLALDQPLCSEVVMSLGTIPLAPYATTGTPEVGDSLQPFLHDHDAILMANHGVVAFGPSLLAAFMQMETVEHFARICLVARQLGCAQPLEPETVHELMNARSRYRQNSTLQPNDVHLYDTGGQNGATGTSAHPVSATTDQHSRTLTGQAVR